MSRPVVVLCLVTLLACSPQPREESSATAPSPWLTPADGPEFTHHSGHDGSYHLPEIIGGGAALFDMDDDGDLDAYLVQSAGGTNRLFENDGDGRFADVTERNGGADARYGMGVATGDYDNDGDVDLYVTNLGPNLLLANDGSGRFTDLTAAAGVGDGSWGSSAAFFDFDADGDLDLYVANYVNWSDAAERTCYNPQGQIDYCLPTRYRAPAMDRLFRNEGDGRFTDISLAAGLDAAFGNGLGVVSADFDGDGHADLFVANDAMINQLWLGDGTGRFRDEALLAGCGYDEQGLAKAGMGVDAQDWDNDGDPDLLVVNLQNETDSFFRNDDGLFSDVTASVGMASVSRGSTRFGVGMVDFDNDSWLDIFEANGRVNRSPEPEVDDVYAEPNLLFRGDPSGRFVELPLHGRVATSRAAVFGDVDNDGGVDVLVVNRDGPAHLLRNVVPDRGHWIRFRVLDSHGRDALGARVGMALGDRRMSRTVRSAYGYLAANDARVHFGLGDATGVAEVTVTWLDGATERFGPFETDRDLTLRYGEGDASR